MLGWPLRAVSGENLEMLVRTVAGDSAERVQHTSRVVRYSLGIASEMGLGSEQARIICLGALFHDIGAHVIPPEIENKPTTLTQAEWRLVETHTEWGFEFALRDSEMREASGAIRYHHEWVDGSGYPDNLKGDEIPLEARVIAVADMYDAITTPRPYRSALSEEDALLLMQVEVGTHLDAACFSAFQAYREKISGIENESDLSGETGENGRGEDLAKVLPFSRSSS